MWRFILLSRFSYSNTNLFFDIYVRFRFLCLCCIMIASLNSRSTSYLRVMVSLTSYFFRSFYIIVRLNIFHGNVGAGNSPIYIELAISHAKPPLFFMGRFIWTSIGVHPSKRWPLGCSIVIMFRAPLGRGSCREGLGVFIKLVLSIGVCWGSGSIAVGSCKDSGDRTLSSLLSASSSLW